MTTNISLTEPGRLSATRSEQINQIYISSFPPSERMPFADIEKSIERGDRQLFIATVQDAIAGFALTMYLPVSNMHYLEYLAVRPDLRNLKTGAALLGYLRDHVATTRANGIILEVESELNAPASELEIRKRRLQFYSRNGYGLITCVPDYRVPAADDSALLSMRLLWWAIDERLRVLRGKMLRDAIIEIFDKSYEKPDDDPLLCSILSELIC